jgi:hypothetical protein
MNNNRCILTFYLLLDSNCASISQTEAQTNIPGEKTTESDDDSETAIGDSSESRNSHYEAERENLNSANLGESKSRRDVSSSSISSSESNSLSRN